MPPGEIIVVDDGSTDDTKSLVQDRFPQVRYLYQENAGVSAARNAGLAAARGEWIALLDSDDAWTPKKLARQRAQLSEAPHIRLCHTEEIWIRNGVRVNAMKKHKKSGGWLFPASLKLCCISPSSVLIHSDVFQDYGTFDESLPACEDYDLWLRVTAREEAAFVVEPSTVKYGGHADQLSRAFWGMDRFRVDAIEKILEDETLRPNYRHLALKTIVQKLEILVAGARKRDNHEAVALYEPRLIHWRVQLPREET